MNNPSRRWQAFGGYLADLWRLARGELTNPHSYLKFIHLNALRRKCGADVIVETGTYRGVTAARCARVFKKVYTIELDPDLAREATRFLAPRRNVEVICGDAVNELSTVFESRDVASAVVFLDGHYSGGVTATTDIPEPALEELNLLLRYKAQVGAILIDDFRSFGLEKDFPSKAQLVETAEKLYPEFSLSIQYDQLALVRKRGVPITD